MADEPTRHEATDLRERVRARFELHEPALVADGVAERRAAVTLLLRAGLAASASEDLLFIQRADLPGDPWSGHMALPGGRAEPDDADLLDTARRELREETAIDLGRDGFVGRLDDVHPVSRHLPSIVVTPFVAVAAGSIQVRGNHEVVDHVWVPAKAFAESSNRGTLRISREDFRREFETIEYEDYTIWGLTLEIVKNYLSVAGSL